MVDKIYVTNDAAAQARLVSVFRSRHWRHGYPRTWQNCWNDRALARVFEGTIQLDASSALSRGLSEFELWYQPVIIGELLRWGHRHGIVAYSDRETPSWTLLRHGPKFIPRGDDSLDVSAPTRPTGGLALSSLVSREEKLRKRILAARKAKSVAGLLLELQSRAPDALVLDDLKAPDLPPVPTVGDLRANIASFLADMPLYRIREVRKTLWSYPDVDKIATDATAPELADLYF